MYFVRVVIRPSFLKDEYPVMLNLLHSACISFEVRSPSVLKTGTSESEVPEAIVTDRRIRYLNF